MSEVTLAVVALLVFGWAVLSQELARHDVTGPIIFTTAGFVLANPDWGALTVDIETGTVRTLAEVTLALVLFSDAARVNLAELRRDIGLPIRLLAIGLPLTMIMCGVTAAIVFDNLTWALAGFVGAALAPTDAALSAQVIGDPRIPGRFRNALNVESGLNDGIAAPVVVFMLAVAAAQLGLGEEGEAATMGRSAVFLVIGVVQGLLFGLGGAAAINAASRKHWAVSGGRRIATLALAFGTFAAAQAIEGNGFIAAIVAGIAFGSRLDDSIEVEGTNELPELGGQLLALVMWFLFGAILLPIAIGNLANVTVIAFALLAFTVFRMLPVAIGMLGSRLAWKDVLFLGWFGPRGLASVVFAFLALEELGETSPVVLEAVSVVALSVLLSVVLHGVTGGLAARRYGTGETTEDRTTGPRATPRGFRHHTWRH